MGAVIIPAMVIVVAIAGVIYFNCKDKKDIHKDSNSTKRSNVEVTHISRYGLILLIGNKEYYLSYERFPWFKRAAVDDVFDVEMLGRNRIRWNALDVDLSLSIINNPEKYPLVANE
uniref:DUF2442 domain-containing protein n=1 Tax=Bacteroides fragilis TaxID=817 RepID=UPI00356295B8